ncbi:sin3-associated polypeptide sap18 [Colletotrichum truncatum]|uniref:Sin3-associated polypeptide sap18 n=1 Tax=Colletotrichum truncatum TaxID=5467 RepID=A0ACC3YJ70_COLTU|nr:sin3-associated polypeptide sap18 [Colletotrichum truncatum]KAF6797190.1 sin3-associated polypeptide sap18 [Colletotrichum truncatum]
MASADREATTPFLLRLFYKNGSFHRPDEFAARNLPPSLSLYTWPTCTLTELAQQIAAEDPSLLPSPSLGTRLAFRLVYPDTRNVTAAAAAHHASAQPRFMVKDLGSVVLGGDEVTAAALSAANGAEGGDEDVDMTGTLALPPTDTADKTLGEAKFVVGDYVSCAILPPLPDGSVAPAMTARNDRTAGPRGPAVGQPSHNTRRDAGFAGRQGRDRERRRPGFGEGRFPEGEWRRGERLPDDPPDRSWGRGRRGGSRW